MIKVVYKIYLDDFEAWGFGHDTLQDIRDKGYMNHFQALAEDLWPDGVDEDLLNDWLWFDAREELKRLEQAKHK